MQLGTVPTCRGGHAIGDCPYLLAAAAQPRGNPDFIEALTSAGYSEEIAHALSYFQINGCFKAVKAYGGLIK